MAKKAFLKDNNGIEILPITRGELVLDSSGKQAFNSNEFLATTSQPGLMSKEDKQKLETIANNTVDTELSNTSTNPVQNKVLTQIINSIREQYLKSAVISGNKLTITDQSNNTVEFFNSTYQIVTNTIDGLVPKYDDVDGTIDTQTTDWVLTNHNGTLGWYKLPVTAFSSNSIQLFVGSKSTNNNNNSNSATTNGNTYLKLFDNSILKNQYNIKGTGLTTVISDDSGTITINVPTSHNQTSSDINSLTGYTKATSIAAITTSDSLNTALGKLELKADTTYELVKGAYDGDGTIENLAEILKVLEGIKDTDTIQAIVGKYLPLSGGTINSGTFRPLVIDSSYNGITELGISNKTTIYSGFGYNNGYTFIGREDGGDYPKIGIRHSDNTPVYSPNNFITIHTLLHSGNYNSYAPTLTGTGASGTWGIDITGNAATATNADKLNGYYAGLTNGSVAIFVPFPNYSSLRNSGYINANYGTSSYGHPDEEFLKGICKWAIATYPSQGDITLMGIISPNSSGTCILHLYSNSGKDSSTLLPRYCRGQYLALNGSLYHFGTINYVWSYNRFAFDYELKNPTNYYWANINITSTPDSTKIPTLGGLNVNGNILVDGSIRFKTASAGTIGKQYSNTDTNMYNYIKINEATGGIKYYSGSWTSGDHSAHQFITSISNIPRLTIRNTTGYIGIGIESPEKSLDVNGIQQIYQRGNDNTAFKDLLLLKQQNSTELSQQNWDTSQPSFGIGFRRYWTSGSSPYGETTHAGIYSTISSNWRGGLVFRTKNNEIAGGTHDTTALRLRPDGHAIFGSSIETNGAILTTGPIVSNTYHQIYNSGSYTRASSNVTGAIVIQLPITSSQFDMINVEIAVYEYNSQAASKIIVGGHPWQGTWYNYSCSIIGGYNRGVRLGIYGGKWCIILGTSSTIWQYPGVFVTHIGTVYDNYSSQYINKCTCSLVTSESGFSALVTPTNVVNATNADTVDNYHASNLTKFYLSPMATDAPADSAKSWFINTMPSASGAIVYNVPGSEKTIIVGKSTGPYGHMLQLNYDDNYLRILRYYNGSWRTTDWEKISAGYADNADKLDGYHIGDLDFRYTRTGYSFISPSDNSMTGSTDLQDWVTNMYNQGGYKGYSSITVGSWWWVRSLDFYSPVGTIRTSGAMIIYSGDGNSNKNYKHFLVLDACAELYGITSNEESWKYYSRFLNDRNYTDFVYSKSTSDSRYLRKDTDDSTPYQYNFTKTDDHAIKVGTIRGTAVGSQAGEYIHLYERVHIGYPGGWGGRSAPSYGLSTYGGAWLATDTGNVGIGTTSPSYKLDVNGDTRILGNLYLGANVSNNYIAFYGNTGDAPGSYATTFIGEHLWGSPESTELLLMKFNDVGNGTDATTVYSSGPDRIRHLAHGHVFQIMTDISQGDFATMANSTAVETKFDIARYQLHAYAPLAIISDGTNSGYDGLVYMRHYSNNDWGLIVDKSQSYSYGVDIRAAGGYALRVGNGNTRLIGATIIGADTTPSYTLDVRGTTRSTDRIYANEWIQFDNATGLYWPNTYGAHFYPNDTSSFGQFRLAGSKNGYSGIHFGSGTGYLTLMDNGSDKGAYQENWDWLWYFNARNGKLSLRTSSDLGADINLNGSVRTNSTYYGYGLYHLSYGSSAYALTSDGGAIHIGSMSVNYANALASQGIVTAISGTSRYSSGLRFGRVYASGYPFSYGNTITIEDGGFGTEIIFNGLGGGGSTGSGEMRFRTHSDWESSEWGNWRTVIDSDNIGSQHVSYADSAGSVAWSNVTDKPSFATVATSGSYNDLTNKPTIPDVSDFVTLTTAQTITGAKTVNNTITFGTNDNYGIRTATNNYCKIGESGKAFFQAYVTSVYTNSLTPIGTGGSIGLTDKRYSYGYFSNAVYATSGFYESSDERLKNILNPVKVDLDKLSKLRKVYYIWKDASNTSIQLGMIAQDVQKLYPELVDVDEETGYLSLAYDKLSVLALEAIDVLYKEHKKLKERVDELEKLLTNRGIL